MNRAITGGRPSGPVSGIPACPPASRRGAFNRYKHLIINTLFALVQGEKEPACRLVQLRMESLAPLIVRPADYVQLRISNTRCFQSRELRRLAHYIKFLRERLSRRQDPFFKKDILQVVAVVFLDDLTLQQRFNGPGHLGGSGEAHSLQRRGTEQVLSLTGPCGTRSGLCP